MTRRSKNPRSSATVAKQRTSKHAADRSRHPRLHPEDLDNDSRVLGAVDQLVQDDRNYWKLTRRICRAQLRHQQLATEDAFVAQLDVEQLISERVNLMLALTARWAFNEGRRSRRRG